MKKHLLLVAALVLFASCATDDLGITQPAAEPAATDINAISLDEALGNMYGLMDVLYGQSTRASRPAIASAETLKSSYLNKQTRSGETLPENLYYIINFENEGGFAILGADRRAIEVIAITEAGSLTMAELLDAGAPAPSTRSSVPTFTLDDLWVRNVDMVDLYDPDDPDETEDGDYLLAAGDIKLQLLKMVEEPVGDGGGGGGGSSPPVSTDYGPWRDATKKGPYLTTKWHQDPPFNMNCPGGYPAGCVPIAVAQILAYGERRAPSYFGATSTWAELKNYNIITYGSTTKTETDKRIEGDLAKIVRAIGKGVKADYNFFWSGQTFATPYAAKQYMKKSLGYGNAKKYESYKENVITSMINGGKPVFIGCLDGVKGHAWVIDGSLNQTRTVTKTQNGAVISTSSEPRFLLHCNFGWGGSYDGYYYSKVFNLSSGAVTTEAGVDDGSGSGKNVHYDWWYRIIEY